MSNTIDNLLHEARRFPPSDEFAANAIADAGLYERAAEDRELSQLRRTVLKQYPNLFAMRILTMHEFQSDVQGAIARRLRFENPAIDDAELEQRAGLTMQVAVGAMRHSWQLWSNDT